MRVESVVARRVQLWDGQERSFGGEPHAHAVYLQGGVLGVRFDGDARPVRLSGSDFLLISPRQPFTLRAEPDASLVCGQVRVEPWSLPRWLHVPAERSHALRAAMDLLAAEAEDPSPDSGEIARRLAGVVLLYAQREQPAANALPDPRIEASLLAMHRSAGRPWTVAELAVEAGMSRSAFAQRFKQLTGEGPMEHLTRWRMQQARELLLETDRTVGDVAASIGYATDGAFHRAFRRETGLSPGEFRRRAQ